MACRRIVMAVALVAFVASARPVAAASEGTDRSAPVLGTIPHIGRLFAVEQPPSTGRGAPILKDVPLVGRLYTIGPAGEPAPGRGPFPVLSAIPFIDRLFR